MHQHALREYVGVITDIWNRLNVLDKYVFPMKENVKDYATVSYIKIFQNYVHACMNILAQKWFYSVKNEEFKMTYARLFCIFTFKIISQWARRFFLDIYKAIKNTYDLLWFSDNTNGENPSVSVVAIFPHSNISRPIILFNSKRNKFIAISRFMINNCFVFFL